MEGMPKATGQLTILLNFGKALPAQKRARTPALSG